MSAVAREALARFRHEAGRGAVPAADAFDHVLEEAGPVGHGFDVVVCERGFEDAGPGFRVPALDVGVEAFAGGEDVVVPGLVVDGAGEGVAGHGFGEVGEGVGGVLLQEGGGAG